MADIVTNFDSKIVSISDYRMNEWYNDLSSVQAKWNEDAVLLSTYKLQKNEALNQKYTIKDQILGVVKELESSRDKLWEDLAKFGGSLYDKMVSDEAVDDVFNQLFDPFLQAVTDLSKVVTGVGLPEIPIIGSLTTVIANIAKTGELISKLPKEIREAARKEAEEKKEAEKALRDAQADFEEAERKYKQIDSKMNWWDRQIDDFENSSFGKVVKEIVEVFKEVLNIVMLIAQNAALAAILMLLEKLEPILGQLADIIAIVRNAFNVLKMLMFSSAQLLRYFYRVLKNKLMDLYNILCYVMYGGWSLPVNGLISAIHADMLCCEFQMSSIELQITKMDGDDLIESDEKLLKKYDDTISLLESEQKAIYPANSREPPSPDAHEALNQLASTIEAVSRGKEEAELQKNLDEAKVDAVKKRIEAFPEIAAKSYPPMLWERTNKDDFLRKSHSELQKAIDAANAKTAEYEEKTAKAKEDLEKLKKKRAEAEKAKNAKTAPQV